MKYNTEFLDYFYHKFHDKDDQEIMSYIDTLGIYRFHSAFNDKRFISFFKNKKKFYTAFKSYIHHQYFDVASAKLEDFQNWILKNRPDYIVYKDRMGHEGKSVKKVKLQYINDHPSIQGKTLSEFYRTLNKNFLVEEYIKQHPILMKFHPDSLNTIRIVTAVDSEHKLHIIGAVLRMGVEGNHVDNISAGGVVAVINSDTGIIEGPLKFKDPRKKIKNTAYHPSSLVKVLGVQLPYWNEVMKLIHEVAYIIPEIRTVGWDIIITKSGPALLEGNQNWGKMILQKAYGRGIKAKLNSISI